MNPRELDHVLASLMDKYGIVVLRTALAIIFIWFGALKPLGMSPAASLVEKTVIEQGERMPHKLKMCPQQTRAENYGVGG